MTHLRPLYLNPDPLQYTRLYASIGSRWIHFFQNVFASDKNYTASIVRYINQFIVILVFPINDSFLSDIRTYNCVTNNFLSIVTLIFARYAFHS